MIVLRMIGGVLLIAAVLVLVYDGTLTLGSDSGLVVTSLGELWFDLHRDSLAKFAKAVQDGIAPWVWTLLSRLLHLPAWPALAALGLGFSALGRPRRHFDLFAN